MEGEGDEIKSKQASKRDRTLQSNNLEYQIIWNNFHCPFLAFRAPFAVYVYHKDADQSGNTGDNKGFSLQYQQLSCGQHYSEM